MGTHVKTQWEHGEKTKITNSMPLKPPPPKVPPKCVFHYLIGCMQILFLKLVITIFGLNQYPFIRARVP
jgi:hypothetical protein